MQCELDALHVGNLLEKFDDEIAQFGIARYFFDLQGREIVVLRRIDFAVDKVDGTCPRTEERAHDRPAHVPGHVATYSLTSAMLGRSFLQNLRSNTHILSLANQAFPRQVWSLCLGVLNDAL